MRSAIFTKLTNPTTQELLDLANEVCREAQEIRDTLRTTIHDAEIRARGSATQMIGLCHELGSPVWGLFLMAHSVKK